MDSHKLVFFPIAGVGDVTWRCLFRRMMGYADWSDMSRQFEGLRYLSDYNETEATERMTSPDYTRAMFVRDPKVRILSNYLDYVVQDQGEYVRHHCCGGREACVKRMLNFTAFLQVVPTCDEPYWRPQSRRMEPRYYPYLNFIGHYHTIQDDAQVLLERIGAWETYGRSGWAGIGDGGDRDDQRFSTLFDTAQVPKVTASTFRSYYFSRDILMRAQKGFRIDYDFRPLNLTRRKAARLDDGSTFHLL